MRKELTKEQRYVLARKRVEKIGKFYKHLSIYIAVNVLLSAIFIFGDMNDGATFSEAFYDYHNYKIWVYWGIGIFFQALNTFGLPLFLSKNWEEKKIKEYMNQK